MVCITEANISSIEDSKVLIVAGMDLVGDREPSSPAPAAPKAEAIKPEVTRVWQRPGHASSWRLMRARHWRLSWIARYHPLSSLAAG